jgi:hypothetical protein
MDYLGAGEPGELRLLPIRRLNDIKAVAVLYIKDPLAVVLFG